MNIADELKERLKQAMRDGNVEAKDHIRSILSKVTEHCVANRLSRTKPVPNEEIIKVIAAHKKSLEKAIKLFEKGGSDVNNEIAQAYLKEIAFCETFLPDDAEGQGQIQEWVDAAVAELGANDVKQVGRIIGHVMKSHKDEKPDGALVKKLALDKLSKQGE
jgi:uncharacterized protein YqeY